MTKYLIVLIWPSEHNEKIGNVAVLQAFNKEEAKQKALKMWRLNTDVAKYLKIYNLAELIDNWTYFRIGN